jgi:cytochrome P450
MRISTRNHAILDIATAGFALAFPRVFGASKRFTRISTAMALSKIGYTLLTRHELGAARVLPMKTHLALDSAAGAALAALPFVLDKQENSAVTACAVGLGTFDIAVAPLTDTRSLPPQVIGLTTGATTELPGKSCREGVVQRERRLPQASMADSLKVHLEIVIPTVAKGPIIRRPKVVYLAERLGFATNAVITMQHLREKYGSGPLMVKSPLRHYALLFDPDDVRRVLDESPEPFATASAEKQAALAHFEPKMALVSHGPERRERRQLNERVLQQDHSVHSMTEHLLPIVDEEADVLLRQAAAVGELRWDEFFEAWFRIVRRVVFGNDARDDTRITDLMEKLRSHGNWAFLKPKRTDLRDELHQRIRRYLQKAESGSLVAYMASKSPSAVSAPENQVPQWLFAFDPAAMATFRALALLATHPKHLARAREEAGDGVAADRSHRPLLRASILESLRLWATTPLLLRQTTRATEWQNGVMPAGTGVLIYAPFFHRDETRIPYAHTFHPDLWIDDDPEVKGDPPKEWPFVPFSGGPAICPGRNVVLLLTSGMLAALIGRRAVCLRDSHRVPPGRLPGTLDNYTLRFALGRRKDRPATTAAAAADV